MNKLLVFLFIFLFDLGLNKVSGSPSLSDQIFYESSCPHWKQAMLLQPTQKKPARTAILIIAPPVMNNSDVEIRWKLGKKVWEHYMNSHPYVDCYFVQSSCFRKDSSEQVWIEGNTIFVADVWYEKERNDRILNKTIRALELLLPNYTHFIRTNINTFFNLEAVHQYMESHYQSMYTTPLWQSQWYTIGYAIIFTKDVADHMCREYNRLESSGEELVSCYHADDSALTSLATGVWPYDKIHPFKCCPSLPYRVRQLMCEKSFNTTRLSRYGALLTPISSLEEAIYYCNLASPDVILYRTRDGLSLIDLSKFYQFILHKIYPGLPYIDLVEYLRSIK